MTGPYADAIDAVSTGLAEWGRLASLVVRSVQPPTDGSDVGVIAETVYDGVPVFVLPGYGRGQAALTDRVAPGTDISTRSRRVLMAGKDCPVDELTDAMLLIFDDQRWQISAIKPTGPSGPIILYDFLATVGQ